MLIVLYDDIYRLMELQPIHQPKLIVIVGVLGLILNIFGLFLF